MPGRGTGTRPASWGLLKLKRVMVCKAGPERLEHKVRPWLIGGWLLLPPILVHFSTFPSSARACECSCACRARAVTRTLVHAYTRDHGNLPTINVPNQSLSPTLTLNPPPLTAYRSVLRRILLCGQGWHKWIEGNQLRLMNEHRKRAFGGVRLAPKLHILTSNEPSRVHFSTSIIYNRAV